MHIRRHLLLAFAVGLAVRLAAGLCLPIEPTWDGVFYERAATQLAQGESYTLRMMRVSAPPNESAFYPVGWPAVLAAWRAIGMPRALDPALTALLGALLIPLAGVLAGRFAGRRSAITAAWAVALWPGGILLCASWMGDSLFALVLCCALVPLSTPRPKLGAFVLSGLLFGLALYVRPTALAIAPLALGVRAFSMFGRAGTAPRSAAQLLAMRRRVPAALAAGALAAALALLVVSPWIARNRLHVGGAVISTNSGANLLVGTIAPYFVPLRNDYGCPRGMRELARDNCRRDAALARIAEHPMSWIALAPLKLLHTFGHEVSGAYQLGLALRLHDPMWHPLTWTLAGISSIYWLALLVFAIRGFRRGRRSLALLLIAPAIAVALMHTIYLGGDRYHQPLVPLFAVLAAPALVRARRLFR